MRCRARDLIAVDTLRLALDFDGICLDVFESQIIFSGRFQMFNRFRIDFVEIFKESVLAIYFQREQPIKKADDILFFAFGNRFFARFGFRQQAHIGKCQPRILEVGNLETS